VQVFVHRADLTAASPPDPIVVIAAYNDEPPIPYSAHDLTHSAPSTVTALYLPTEMVLRTNVTLPGAPTFPGAPAPITVPQTVLASTWRDDAEKIINGEANRRIIEVFPDYKQRNSTAQMQMAVNAYGSDSTIWPPEAKTFKNEYDRGWTYVAAVRERTPLLIADLPPDPTADGYWPTRITPVSFSVIF